MMTEYDQLAAIFRKVGYDAQTSLDGTSFAGSLEWAAEEYATVIGYLGLVTIKIGRKTKTFRIEKIKEVKTWEEIARDSVPEDLTKAMAYNISEALEAEFLRRLVNDLAAPREVATEYYAYGAAWFGTQWEVYSQRVKVHVEYDEDTREFRAYAYGQPINSIDGLPFRDALDDERCYDAIDFNTWVRTAAEFVYEYVIGIV